MRFSDPAFLWLALPAAAVWLVSIYRLRRHLPYVLALVSALGLAALILAAAGSTVPTSERRIQLVAVADISDSIFELDAQSEKLAELLRALDGSPADAGVVVFAADAGIELPLQPLDRLLHPRDPHTAAGLPDLAHPHAVVRTSGTDIAAALNLARGMFTRRDASRAVLLLSDFRPTRGNSAAAVAALAADGVSLLATPAALSASRDVRLDRLFVPETAASTRALPIEITVASQTPGTVSVSVLRHSPGAQPHFVEARTVDLRAGADSNPNAECRATVRLLDHPPGVGVFVYTATVSGVDGPIPGDIRLNNSLSAAVRVTGPSRWAVLARKGSTLETLARDSKATLGTEARLFLFPDLPTDGSRYDDVAGILIDGFSSAELPPDSAALRALHAAAAAGKSIVAIGGEAAFGAGGHQKDGAFEQLLPVEMTPEDDRVRSVLFLMDVSSSMNDTLSRRGASLRKKDFAAEELLAVRKLRPQDRLGLITFSASAKLAAPLSNEPQRSAFLEAVRSAKIEAETDLYAPLALAREVLAADDAQEQLVVLLSDGVQTTSRPRDEILREAAKLCPLPSGKNKRRTTLLTFGIGVGALDFNAAGEALLKDLAAAGGGTYSPDFLILGERLSKTFAEGEREFYVRREPFSLRSSAVGAALFDTATWPQLHFRNRVKAKPGADVALFSLEENSTRPPDPLLVLSGPRSDSLGRSAVLSLALDGPEGSTLLAAGSAGRALLPRVLSWAEARPDSGKSRFRLSAESLDDDRQRITLRVFDPVSGEPDDTLHPSATLTPLNITPSESGADTVVDFALHIDSPGTYSGEVSAPPASVCRLSVRDASGTLTLAERFVSTPSAAETRRFGIDRAAMAALVAQGGPDSRTIETPRDLAQWLAQRKASGGELNLRAPLLGLALALFLFLYATRRRTSSP